MACHNAQAKSRHIDARRRKAYSTHGQRLLPLWRGVPRIMITILPISFYFFFPPVSNFSRLSYLQEISVARAHAGPIMNEGDICWQLGLLNLCKTQTAHKDKTREWRCPRVQPRCELAPLFLLLSLCAVRALPEPQILHASWRLCDLVIFYSQHVSIGSGLLTWLHVASTTFTKKSVGLIFDLRLLL